MALNRREYLGLAGAAAGATLAGCGETLAQEDDAEYETGDEDVLLPPPDGVDWSVTLAEDGLIPDHDYNPYFPRVYVDTADEEEVPAIVVLLDVNVFETVGDAETEMERWHAIMVGPKEYPLADHALISDDGTTARLTFRESNAFARLYVFRDGGGEWMPDRVRTANISDDLYDYWETADV